MRWIHLLFHPLTGRAVSRRGRLTLRRALPSHTAWLRFFLACSVLAVAPLVAQPSGGQTVDLAIADALLASGEAAAAEKSYAQLTRRFPGLIEAHRGLNRARARQGYPREAAAGLRRLGEGLLSAGRYAQAAEVLEEGVAFDPGSAELRVVLGRSLMLDQRFGAAAEHLAQGLELGAERGETQGLGGVAVRVYLGLAQWESGQLVAAEATLRTAASVSSPNSLVARQQLGRLLLWQGEYSEAIELLRAAVAANPTSADAHLDLAKALEGAGEWIPALAAYDRVIALASDRYPPHYSRARILMRLGRRDEARTEMALYRELYEGSQLQLRDEGTLRARLDRGWELLDKEEATRAEELFAALGDQVDALVGLALARSARGLHAAAVTSLERAVTLAPERQDLRMMLFEERQAAATP